MLEQGKSVRSPPPEVEGAAEITCDELTATPIPHPPAVLEGRRYRKLGVKLSLGRRQGWGEGALRFGFSFSLLYSNLIDNKLSKFP